MDFLMVAGDVVNGQSTGAGVNLTFQPAAGVEVAVTSFFGGTSGFYIALSDVHTIWFQLVFALGLLSIFVGAFGALFQKNINKEKWKIYFNIMREHHGH